ncbi:MAG TPA: mersacidin/lichenicidin family type 2 lantibiotic [Thermoanaerobaculia bacterium]|jgi:mersacidin/lichenicidin family type 2 lantibiotic|nr:mersacidin/lichenicidin family type 2 lantibiotic [Thermoanaerobaculia bacterium]
MKKIDLYRAFRDQEYYQSLTDAERAGLGAHPSGLVELDNQDLRAATGAAITALGSTIQCTPCPGKNCAA